jgi:hypothetical protein
LALDIPFDKKLQEIVFFFQKISHLYEIEDYAEIISLFFINILKDKTALLSITFFLEVFSLSAPNYSRTKDDEVKYIILPALTLVELKKKNFDIDKIIGGILQIDHSGTMGYLFSQIIDYLLENDLISVYNFIEIFENILIKEYASYLRIGRFLGMLLEFNFLKIDYVIKILNTIIYDLSLHIRQISELLYGATRSISSSHIEISLIKSIFKLENLDIFLLKDQKYLRDISIGIAMLLSNYLYDNKSFSHLITFFFKIEATLILATAFKYMIDHSIISVKRFCAILSNEIYYKKLTFKNIALMISPIFSNSEISHIILDIVNNDRNCVDYEIFIEILDGFCKSESHQFKISDIESLINKLQKIDPYILTRLQITNVKEFIKIFEFKMLI